MVEKIFISRSISDDSPIHSIANRYGKDLEAFSLLHFENLAFTPPDTTWIFFYSKAGVRAFFNALAIKEASRSYKIACYGPATAKFCSQFQLVDYTGNVRAGDVADDLADLRALGDLTFLCGTQSLRSVQKKLNEDDYNEVEVYEHYPKSGLDLSTYRVAILTSPMNVAAFFSNLGTAAHFIVIGATTSKALAEHKVNYTIAPEPSEAGLALSLDTYLAHI